MKTAIKVLISTLALGVASAGHASPITGSLTFKGEVTAPNATDIKDAEELRFSNMDASTGTGTFAGISTQDVTYNDLAFDPFNGAVTPLWTDLSFGGNDFVFDLEKINTVNRNQVATDLTIGASGTVRTTNVDSGLSDTPWSWDMSSNQAAPDNVTLSVAQARVPAPTSVALLGLGLVGFATAARRIRKGQSGG